MKNFTSKIFLDGGDPTETKNIKDMLGFLDGQTTNPTLIAKNLKAREEESVKSEAQSEKKLTEEDAIEEYKKIVQAMNKVIPAGSISIQVFADKNSTSTEMITQARERTTWIPNASIKLPCLPEGLKAAQTLCAEMPINITLVFSQSQAAAVYAATKKAQYPVFISPFVGRLDDRGECGMDLIENILRMYRFGDSHVEVLTASTRNIDHVLYALKLKSNIITIPSKVISAWKAQGLELPSEKYVYPKGDLKPIIFDENIKLDRTWEEYELFHELTDKGVNAFWTDWHQLFS